MIFCLSYLINKIVYSNYLSWYYGKIKRTEAEQLLLQEPHDGAFLLRDSESTAGKETHIFHSISRGFIFAISTAKYEKRALNFAISHSRRHFSFKKSELITNF